jgi:hypothetical protein
MPMLPVSALNNNSAAKQLAVNFLVKPVIEMIFNQSSKLKVFLWVINLISSATTATSSSAERKMNSENQ